MAVITSTSGSSPLPRSVARCSDAEAVLLVDHDQPERAEAHVASTSACVPTTQVDAAAGSISRRAARAAPRRSSRRSAARRGTATAAAAARWSEEVLLGEDLRRRHERDLQTVLHGDERGEQRDDRLPGSDVALEQAVHRLRTLQIVDDLLAAPARCPPVSRNGSTRPRRFANPIVDRRSRPACARPPAERRRGQHAGLKQERFFENQPLLSGRRELIQRVNRGVGGRKMRSQQRGAPGWKARAAAEPPRAGGPASSGGKLLQRVDTRVVAASSA